MGATSRVPVGVPAPRRQQQLRHRISNRVRTVMRGPTAVVQRRAAARVVTRQPFVARLSADGVTCAEFGHVVEAELGIINESFPVPWVLSPARASNQPPLVPA